MKISSSRTRKAQLVTLRLVVGKLSLVLLSNPFAVKSNFSSTCYLLIRNNLRMNACFELLRIWADLSNFYETLAAGQALWMHFYAVSHTQISRLVSTKT
ncbi:hypothetical protein BC008_43325 [Mastigocoleus testarum BC008]|uniref:Uncharacterized protein n=1 Tax=Mastigocoleus testarum BC008 TaxID=371196 RepID=A0A0V7ZQ48_9CYAN|nr:hypothetical protein BC008_43325 [Mastigocoleus testarum BC008]